MSQENRNGFLVDYDPQETNTVGLWFFDGGDEGLQLMEWDTSVQLDVIIQEAHQEMEWFAEDEEIDGFIALQLSEAIELQRILQCGNTVDLDYFLKQRAA